VNPLTAVFEIRFYLSKGLLSKERAGAFLTKNLGERAKSLGSSDLAQRRKALEKLPPP
jgi:hypothetical protein